MSAITFIHMKQLEKATQLVQKQEQLIARNKEAARVHLLAMKTLLAKRPIY